MALYFLLSGDVEYRLTGDSMWVTVGTCSVEIKKTDEGVVVDLFALGKEDEGAVASTYMFDGEEADG